MMHRQVAYAYTPPVAAPPQRYSGTSSAFSASANPNEDWTKIADLAERRRIQNRIAQRNYRKKLKKRLEDLERRAASSSASPEQKPAELEASNAQKADNTPRRTTSPLRRSEQPRRMAETHTQASAAVGDDGSMFSHQYTRQLSTSPPPFTYSRESCIGTVPTLESSPYTVTTTSAMEPVPYTAYPIYPAVTTSGSEPSFATPYLGGVSYPSPIPAMYLPAPPKQEFYMEEINPFSMSYASLAGIDISSASYAGANSQTPSLSESFGPSTAASPLDMDMGFPATPASIPNTPAIHLY